MTAVRLPGLVDVHTHMRDPGQTHKEDWSTGTAAALAGGFTTVLAMPNLDPAVVDAASLAVALEAAGAGARCDYGQYLGGSDGNAEAAAAAAPDACGLKLYLDQTFGPLRLSDVDAWWRHLEAWPFDRPLAVHAEGPTLASVLLMATFLERPMHVCHISTQDELVLVMRARDRGVTVTCEVTPHHLFLDASDAERLGSASAVRPPLATPEDRQFLWDHLADIDVFATDHAPHTSEEKASADPPPGFPGLETALGLLLAAVHDGALSLDDLGARMATNPRRIFGLPEQDAEVEVDPDHRWTVRGAEQETRAKWSPFEGRELSGRVMRVVIRGVEAYRDGEVLAAPGSGSDVRKER